MNAIRTFFRDLTLVPQGITVVIAAFLPIIAIVAMGPAVVPMIDHFASDPDARKKVPVMIGAPGLAMAVLAPFAGWFVDRFGRRRLLLACTLLYGVFGSAPYWLDDLDQIFYSRLLLGVSEAGILTTVNTLIGDYWDEKGRKNWLFLQGLLGPFISGIFALIVGFTSAAQWNAVFLVYLVAFPIWAAMLVWLFEPAKRAEAHPGASPPEASGGFPIKAAILTATVTFFCSMLYYVFILNGALVFKAVGVADSKAYGSLIFIPQLFILAGAALFRLLASRGHALQLGVMFALLGIGLGGMGLASSVLMMIGFLIIQQTAAGMAVPTLINWTQSKYDNQHRGAGMGLWTCAFFLAQSQSPRLVDAIEAAQGSIQISFLWAGIAGVMAGALAVGVALATQKAAWSEQPKT